MVDDEHCPNCHKSLRGKPIPENQQQAYGGRFFSEKIGISDLKKDRIVRWQCPFCHYEWKE